MYFHPIFHPSPDAIRRDVEETKISNGSKNKNIED